ncbi:hypothetical protein [Hydrogenimonas thermophila]|uniref:Uncharacterized protein n=1 Tax=Hydrogenimonas thermophila TaxID=223786 RepID=A0A1I5L3C2_9BACT|nr:hypothetical protein [Hydrogenimonas thermophila]SFO91356.1 hypothetical protein SAMN05216234_1024 [Hydrogenimonas thermophila]
MSRKHNENVLPPAYEGVERHLMALFYSGVYVTNADIVKVGKLLGLELPLKDRMALLKQIMHHAHENNMKSQMMQGFMQLLQERTKIYNDLAQNFPTAAPLIQQWIQKARSTIMLLQREMRSNPYE